MDNNNYLDLITTTGNKGKDAGIGGMMGLTNSLQPRGDYYVRANYLGRGRADVGLGYAENPNYRDPYKLYSPMMAYYNRNKNLSDESLTKNNNDNRLVGNILGRLSGMGGNIGNWANKMMGNKGNGFVRQNIDDYVYDRTQPTNNISDYVNRYVNDIDYNDNTLRRAITDASYYDAIPGMRGL